MKQIYVHAGIYLEFHGENDFTVESDYGDNRVEHVTWAQAAGLLGSAIMTYLEKRNQFVIEPEPEPEPPAEEV